VSTDDPDPVDAFEQLSHVSNQPELCRSGVLDSTSARVKILLDLGKTSEELVSKIKAQLGTIYPQHSVVHLKLEGGELTEEEQNAMSSLYLKFLPETRSVRGLSWLDVERMNAAVEQLVCANALPWLERKLTSLDANITAKRKGLRNQLRNFLRTEPQSFAGGKLSLQQVEWQCRLAGDIAFHLRAYETAFGFYRNICGDLKQEKWTQIAAAGCYEMSGLTAMLANIVPSIEISRLLDQAVELFGNTPGAVRAAVFQAFALRGQSEAADKIVRVNGLVGGNPLQSGLLLELAADLHSVAGMKRKEAFTRVLAGHMFNKVDGGKRKALELYASVMEVYRKDWPCIRDHLLFTMSKLDYGLGEYERALSHLVALFDNISETASIDKHANYVKLLMYVCKSLGGSAGGDGIFLPVVRVQEVTTQSVVVELRNPLLVAVDVENLSIRGDCESEVTGVIHLGPLETRCLNVMVMFPSEQELIVTGVEWTLFGLITCRYVLP
jgi:hypothetical protein